jgi:uncharacterized linocin/CFP29 family protein
VAEVEILDRKSAPLRDQDWARLDEAVVSVAKRTLVGRRIIEVLGPLGAGVYSMPYSVFSGKTAVGVDLVGENADFVVEAAARKNIILPVLYKDFKLFWRDVEADQHLGLPLDVSTAAVAANFVAMKEDDLIFNGSTDLGHTGLLMTEGRSTVKLGNWEENGGAINDVLKGIKLLTEAGHFGPYAMVTSPKLYGRMVRVYGNTGMLELEQIKAIITGGVFYSNAVPEDKAVILAIGSQNFNLAIGQDLITSYLGPANMNHVFRVFETMALIIRRPDAICTFE